MKYYYSYISLRCHNEDHIAIAGSRLSASPADEGHRMKMREISRMEVCVQLFSHIRRHGRPHWESCLRGHAAMGFALR